VKTATSPSLKKEAFPSVSKRTTQIELFSMKNMVSNSSKIDRNTQQQLMMYIQSLEKKLSFSDSDIGSGEGKNTNSEEEG